MAFPAGAEAIDIAETELGVRLPESFRERLLTNNGGEVQALDASWQLNPVFDISDARRAKRTAMHIVRETAEARAWRGFPASAVAIASDGCGNHPVLLPHVEGKALQEAVYVWWHESMELERVAESFSQLEA